MSTHDPIVGNFDLEEYRRQSQRLFQKELSTTAGSMFLDKALTEIERLRRLAEECRDLLEARQEVSTCPK